MDSEYLQQMLGEVYIERSDHDILLNTIFKEEQAAVAAAPAAATEEEKTLDTVVRDEYNSDSINEVLDFFSIGFGDELIDPFDEKYKNIMNENNTNLFDEIACQKKHFYDVFN